MNESPENDALRDELKQLRDDLSALSQTVQERSQHRVQAGVDKARECFDDLCGEARSRPFTWMVAAFGAGLLVGKALRH